MKKPQENYPGPRPKKEKPDYVKEWEAEPTEVQDEVKPFRNEKTQRDGETPAEKNNQS